MRSLPRPRRCDYCHRPAVVWLRYTGHISRSIRPLTGGDMTLYVSSCAEHEGCPNWAGHMALNHKNATVLRTTTPTDTPTAAGDTDTEEGR